MSIQPRILALGSAQPPHLYHQDAVAAFACERTLGAGWHDRPDDRARALKIERLFAASGVRSRRSAIDVHAFYVGPRTTGERMAAYQTAAYDLGRAACEACLREAVGGVAARVTDLVTVSCTGYGAPGLDIQLARDLAFAPDVRRVAIGHMGCYGALVGLRHCLAVTRAYPRATAAMLSVELASLHFTAAADLEALTTFALFGDAAAALLIGAGDEGPALVDTYCAADFAAAAQMSWTISDQGFVMGLSPRVPVTLRRNVAGVVDRLLEPHGLRARDVAHWLVHPGGPSILDAVQRGLGLADEQMAPSWQVLADHGNCSSTTVLLILEDVLRSGRARPGDWGVMMAFGPGLTLETCLLRF